MFIFIWNDFRIRRKEGNSKILNISFTHNLSLFSSLTCAPALRVASKIINRFTLLFVGHIRFLHMKFAFGIGGIESRIVWNITYLFNQSMKLSLNRSLIPLLKQSFGQESIKSLKVVWSAPLKLNFLLCKKLSKFRKK